MQCGVCICEHSHDDQRFHHHHHQLPLYLGHEYRRSRLLHALSASRRPHTCSSRHRPFRRRQARPTCASASVVAAAGPLLQPYPVRVHGCGVTSSAVHGSGDHGMTAAIGMHTIHAQDTHTPYETHEIDHTPHSSSIYSMHPPHGHAMWQVHVDDIRRHAPTRSTRDQTQRRSTGTRPSLPRSSTHMHAWCVLSHAYHHHCRTACGTASRCIPFRVRAPR